MIFNAFLIALREIRRNLTRAFLTVLGIIIGVAAVITMVTLGEGATEAVKGTISNLGSNLLILRPGLGFGPRSASAGIPNFSEDDVAAIRDQVPDILSVIPVRNSSLSTRFLQNARNTQVVGSTREYFIINRWELGAGRFFNNVDLESSSAVCVIGDTVKRELFSNIGVEPLGQKIHIGGVACEIVGILKHKGQMGWRDQDDTIITPLTTFQQRLLGRASVQDIDLINIAVRDGANTEKITSEIALLMRQRRNLAPSQDNNFFVMEPGQISEAMTQSTRTMTKLLAAVAGVSLLVGGIGIMNIMLVSVTERTREIGIRLAIGARAREVLLQFLVEAVTLSCLGGLFGIALAVFLCAVLAPKIGVHYLFNPQINIISFIFSAAVGIIFGFTPARRAANLDPIEALRHE
jgi:putative ABC transport system permease protein